MLGCCECLRFCLTLRAMQASLSATNLACRRGDRLLFKGLSFDLGAGEALHLTGANGTGKTTLIRALAGLTTPFAGEIARADAVGLLDERMGLDPDLPLGRALAFWQRVDGCSDPSGALLVLGLEPLLEVPVRYLSTGQRKRAAIARLLNSGRRIWLLDEPLNGLDTQAKGAVEALVAQHCGGGGIALVASHQALDLPEHLLPVEQSGEAVGAGAAQQLLFLGDLRVDEAEGGNKAIDPTLGVPEGTAVGLGPVPVPILGTHTIAGHDRFPGPQALEICLVLLRPPVVFEEVGAAMPDPLLGPPAQHGGK